ncbi:MAG: hypothetical protein WCG04_05880, partial [Alphaproteobacteria bacterium]
PSLTDGHTRHPSNANAVPPVYPVMSVLLPSRDISEAIEKAVYETLKNPPKYCDHQAGGRYNVKMWNQGISFTYNIKKNGLILATLGRVLEYLKGLECKASDVIHIFDEEREAFKNNDLIMNACNFFRKGNDWIDDAKLQECLGGFVKRGLCTEQDINNFLDAHDSHKQGLRELRESRAWGSSHIAKMKAQQQQVAAPLNPSRAPGADNALDMAPPLSL